MAEKHKQPPPLWRLWVDTRRKVVSFHEAPGCRLLEFRSYEHYQTCLDEYTAQRYRYQ